MHILDWIVVGAYFLVMIGIGLWAKRRVHSARDFFTAGGKMPWWLSGFSHHMSGYSAAVFVAYAAIAYQLGFVLYVWWALGITFAMVVGAFAFAPKWPRLRERIGIISPLEYLRTRYNLPTQQLLAWSGSALKVFDVGAKWAATAVLLNIFSGLPIPWGIVITGGVTVIYATIGGLWADALTDFGQFVIQFIAVIAMIIGTMRILGVGFPFTIWSQLPASHSQWFNGQYTLLFVMVYLLINTLSYNGGTWNLAQRFIASPKGSTARRAALLSAGLYLIWPLFLFMPMWAAPLILPDLKDPTQAYGLLAEHLLPVGLLGLVLAGIFSHTMAMSSSDSGAISAVVTRDIIPMFTGKHPNTDSATTDKTELLQGRLTVLIFTIISMIVALFYQSFGGVIGLIVTWFGGLVGPIAIPMLWGMLKHARKAGPVSAISSWAIGVLVFYLTHFPLAAWLKATFPSQDQFLLVGSPVIIAIIVFYVTMWIWPKQSAVVDALVDAIQSDEAAESPVPEVLAQAVRDADLHRDAPKEKPTSKSAA